MTLRFLADMGVAMSVVEWLRGAGYDVVHLQEQGLQRMENGGIFLKAIDENRVVLTFDLDFGEIVASTKSVSASVVVFRLQNATSKNVISRLATVLAVSTEALLEGAVISVEEGRHRVRVLPIGSVTDTP